MALLRFKRSAVPAKVPSLADLSLGELAINTFDGKVYMRRDNGTASIVEVGGGAGVLSFNSRTGAVTLTSGDVTTALGYTPASRAGDTFTGNIGITSGSPSITLTSTTSGRTATFGMTDAFNFNLNAPNGGILQFGDFRAPIFFDSNNTAYFADPAGTSSLNLLNVENDIQLTRTTNAWGYITRPNVAGFRNIQFAVAGGSQLENVYANTAALRSSGDVRGSMFYDEYNTAFFVDPNSTSVLNALNVNGSAVFRSDWTTRFQSISDFVSGTLVTTDIPATGWAGDSFIIEITGKSYDGSNPPFKAIAQGYLYNDTIINFSGINYGGSFSSFIRVFQDGGVLKFWWPRISYWNSFNVNVMGMDGPSNNTITRNRVTSITDSTEPTGTKKVTINLNQALRENTWINNKYFGSDGAIYGTIFVDSNNGGYYLDPTSGGVALRTVGYWQQDNTAWAGDINGKIQYHANNWYFNSAASWIFRASSGGQPFEVTQGGAAIASADMRAPIFYDNNNTAYYCDPNSDSIFFKFQNINQRVAYDRGWGNFPSITVYNTTDQGPQTDFRIHGIGGSSGGDYNVRLLVDGTIESLSDVRGPAFFDSNDTAFYLNPASDIRVRALKVTGETEYPGSINSDWEGGYYHFSNTQNTPNGAFGHGHIIRLNADWNVQQFWGTGTDWDFWFRKRLSGSYGAWHFVMPSTLDRWNTTSEGQARFYFSPSGRTFIRSGNGVEFRSSGDGFTGEITNGGNWIASVDMRAPIFYDNNNTGYRIDPNGVSQLNYVLADNWFRSQNDTGWFHETYGGGIWMTDTTWVRVYNNKQFFSENFIQSASSVRAPIFYNSNDTTVRWAQNELVLRGGSPTIYFRDTDSNSAMIHCNSNLLYVLRGGNDTESWATVNGHWPLVINLTNNDMTVGGNFTAVGNVTAFSDISVKDNVERIGGALERVSRIRGVTYTRTDLEDKQRRYGGVIAQEIEQVLPEAIFEQAGMKAVDYNATIGLLIEAIKELTNEIETLKADIRSK
jgi:hypothetical protein